MTLQVKLVLLLWVILVLDPHWWLASLGMPRAIILRAHIVPIIALAAALAFKPRRLKVVTPLLLYAAYVVVSTPFAFNRGLASSEAKLLLVVVGVMLPMLMFIRSASHARFVVLVLLLYRYAWFGIHGLALGRVRWDPLIGNPDQFGSVMAMGVGSAGAIALASTEPRFHRLAMGIALLSAIGLVSSFARGAFLVAPVVLFFLWYRAEGKRIAHAGFVVLFVVATIFASSFFTDVSEARGRGNASSWWTEISSLPGDVQDDQAEDRRLVWRIGWRVFTEHPVFGVGPGSWGAYAGANYEGDFLGERFSRNPMRLWARAMHNAYLQQLAELGVIGFGLFVWVIWDFWRRCAFVRRHATPQDTSLFPGLRTRMVATAFEASMLATLVAGLLYNVMNFWIFALIVANALFHEAWVRRHRALVGVGR